jgi:hypothetical protein
MVWWKAVSKTATAGQVREGVHHGPDPLEVRGVVQGRQVDDLLDALDDVRVDPHRGGEEFPAVHHPVPRRGKLREIPQRTVVRIQEGLQDQLDGPLWFGMSVSRTTASNPVRTCLIREPAMPMRSTNPLANTDSSCMFMSWYFKDELPQFRTRIFTSPPASLA